MAQRTTEWLDKNKVNTDYHERQFKEPYRSTLAFCIGLKQKDLSTAVANSEYWTYVREQGQTYTTCQRDTQSHRLSALISTLILLNKETPSSEATGFRIAA